jgi:hypothetical protein
MTNHTTGTDEPVSLWNGRYHARWGDDERLHSTIADAVSTVSGEARSAVSSQYDRAHAIAVKRLFSPEGSADGPSTGLVSFVLAGCLVSVYSDGRLSVGVADATAVESEADADLPS